MSTSSPPRRRRRSSRKTRANGNTPAQFARFIAQEQARWKAVVARAKIKPD